MLLCFTLDCKWLSLDLLILTPHVGILYLVFPLKLNFLCHLWLPSALFVLLVWDPGVGCVRCTKHKGYIGKNKASLKKGWGKSRAAHSDATAEAWAPNVWFKARSSLAHSWASSVLGSQFRTLVLQPSHGREVGFFFSSLLASVHTMCTQSVLFPTGFSEGDRYIFYKLFCWIFFF